MRLSLRGLLLLGVIVACVVLAIVVLAHHPTSNEAYLAWGLVAAAAGFAVVASEPFAP